MKLSEIIDLLESFAPLSLQEDYDNSGLLIGKKDQDVSKCLITLDCTEEVLREAIERNCDLIVSHHPLIFSGLKSITGRNELERIIIEAIKNNVAIYAIHTNLDNVQEGVNFKMAEKIGLINGKVLQPKQGVLKKLVFYAPEKDADKIRNALFEVGLGSIGNYEKCSFNSSGTGTFEAGQGAEPFVGEINKFHTEKECKVEAIFPDYKTNAIVSTLLENHPYEEVAYDIYPLENEFSQVGSGYIGELPTEVDLDHFFSDLKNAFNVKVIRHTSTLNKKVKRVALCGGSGSFLLQKAIMEKADVFVSADFKYHQFFDAEKKIVIADIGHYESEQYTGELIQEVLQEKFPNFATYLTRINTNPINYI